MRIIINLFIILLFSGICRAEGIIFETGMSFKAIKKKAKAEHKLIFIDCYATWCGPCRFMASEIFPKPEVARLMNEKFICISLQMDSTKKDGQEVRDRYADARMIEKEYQIDGYPSFLFLNSDGEPLHKLVGASENAADFIAKVNEALQPDRQYFTMKEHYQQHVGDSTYLYHALSASLGADDKQTAASIADLLIDCLKNPFTKDNLHLIAQATRSSHSKGFALFFQHSAEVDTTLGVNSAYYALLRIIAREEIDPLTGKDAPLMDWDKLYATLKSKYPQWADKIIVWARPNYYAGKGMWKEYGAALVDYVNKMDDHHDLDRLNDFAWNIFLKCDDPVVLSSALEWSRITFSSDQTPNDNRIDTYASLLYKMGDVKSAICWEQKALSLVTAKSNNTQNYNSQKYTETIARMKKGEKLWE